VFAQAAEFGGSSVSSVDEGVAESINIGARRTINGPNSRSKEAVTSLDLGMPEL
jgi:hypothetical protein